MSGFTVIFFPNLDEADLGLLPLGFLPECWQTDVMLF